MTQRVWLKCAGTPDAVQFMIVRKNGDVLTGTVMDIDMDKFDADRYGEADHDVAEVWTWGEETPVRCAIRVNSTPVDARTEVSVLEVQHPDGRVLARHTSRVTRSPDTITYAQLADELGFKGDYHGFLVWADLMDGHTPKVSGGDTVLNVVATMLRGAKAQQDKLPTQGD